MWRGPTNVSLCDPIIGKSVVPDNATACAKERRQARTGGSRDWHSARLPNVGLAQPRAQPVPTTSAHHSFYLHEGARFPATVKIQRRLLQFPVGSIVR